ncbi:MAG: hypothetical protein BMS9Abin37_1135 [Acidobacteriota bacterium]|nr:MAG: hypothetical protein BMS9Abin37_1135 [Acidobacteriota bacterium]
MTNEAQREVWSAADVAATWAKTEHISDHGTPPLMKALKLVKGERVLDVACGGGKTTVAAARAVGPAGHVTGVDISESMLALAKTRNAEAGLANVELVLADAQVDEFPSGPFDAALSQFGIMFFDDPVAALTNIRRHLTPGGRAAFIVWQPEERMVWSPAHVVVKYLPPPEQDAADTLERAGSWGDTAFAKDVMTSAGFADARVEERNVDAEVPPETDIPASLLTGVVDAEHRETVLAEWEQQRARLTDGDVMRLDLKMNLITGRVPS